MGGVNIISGQTAQCACPGQPGDGPHQGVRSVVGFEHIAGRALGAGGRTGRKRSPNRWAAMDANTVHMENRSLKDRTYLYKRLIEA